MDEDIDFDDLLGEEKPGELSQCPATNQSSYTEAADIDSEVSTSSPDPSAMRRS